MTSQADELTSLPAAEKDAPAVAEVLTDAFAGTGEADYRPRLPARLLLHAALLLAALLFAAIASPGDVHRPALEWIACYGAFIVLFERLLRTSRSRIQLDLLNDTRDLLLATSVGAIATLSVRVLLTDDPTVAAQTLNIWAFTSMVLVPGKLALARLEARDRRLGAMGEPTVIVGAGTVGQLTAKRLLERPELGLRPVGFLDKNPLQLNGSSTALPVLGASWDLDEVVRRYRIKHAIFTFSTAPHDVLLRMVRRCHELGISVLLVPRLFEKMTAKISIAHVGGLPLISIHPANPKGWQFKLKYGVERVTAAVLLVLLSPVLLVSALAVWLSDRGPILYRQRRVGLDGQEFNILKFRSMRSAPEEEGLIGLRPDTAPGGIGGIERRTPVGKILRRTSLDELPQLINVLRGEMSLVGPRPERPEFAEIFHRDVRSYGDRLRVKSGITGWAQVHRLRGQTSLSERVEWDNYYIENWSFWLDIKILLLTVRTVLRFDGE
jgi:exopolysaccharide biosynthesis polyprenyl glycosylphosphotransferase